MPTRASQRATDRAFFWNALCVFLIVLAVVTAFIDLMPTQVSIGLCVLGVLAGLVGVPLYISQAIADWKSARSSPRPQDDPAAESGEPAVESAAAVSPVVAPVVAPGREAQSVETDEGPDAAAPAETASEPAERRCSCHGLPVHD